jgi:magnesium-transporting ATPase (P-type)
MQPMTKTNMVFLGFIAFLDPPKGDCERVAATFEEGWRRSENS